MSIEQQIASLVSAANNLTNVVTGKVGEIDEKIAEAGQLYASQLDELKGRLPRLTATRNFSMSPNADNTMVADWGVHQDISVIRLRNITPTSEATGRPADDVAFLQQVQADVREQYPDFDIQASNYWRTFVNVWQMSWNKRSDANSAYLAYPFATDQTTISGAAAVPQNSYLTIGAFVRVVEGEVEGAWAVGSTLGKWRWCTSLVVPTKSFGSYVHLHPMRKTSAGVIQVFAAGACTGVISHPGDWGTMLSMSQG